MSDCGGPESAKSLPPYHPHASAVSRLTHAHGYHSLAQDDFRYASGNQPWQERSPQLHRHRVPASVLGRQTEHARVRRRMKAVDNIIAENAAPGPQQYGIDSNPSYLGRLIPSWMSRHGTHTQLSVHSRKPCGRASLVAISARSWEILETQSLVHRFIFRYHHHHTIGYLSGRA